MYVIHKNHKVPSSVLSSTESDLGSFSNSIEAKTKPFTADYGFVPRAGGLARDVNDTLTRIMIRHGSHVEPDSEGTPELKAKLNSLISIMVSTIMCLAARCPVRRSNIQTTKMFLSTIVNDNGESPRNIKGLLALLKSYDGPFEGETPKVIAYERSPSPVETVTKTTEVVLEPAVPPPPHSVDRVRTSRTRSRVPSLSPVKRSTDQRKHVWNP